MSELVGIVGTELGETVEVLEVLTEQDRRNTVTRMLITTGRRAGSTVIVKQTVGFAASDADPQVRLRLYREAVAATVLTRLAPGEHTPYFHGLDPDHGLMIFDDLGSAASLVQPLLNGAGDDARTAMINFVRRLGALHAATAGKLQVWDESVVELGAPEELLTAQALRSDAQVLEQGLAGLDSQLDDLGLPTLGQVRNTGLGEELAAIRSAVTSPGPFTVVIHQDPCPDNVLLTEFGTRLIDFEFARPGHALIDGLYPQLPFPTCWCCNEIPDDFGEELRAVYRSELITGVPEAGDDDLFDDATVHLMAYWLIAAFQWIFDGVLAESRTWGIASTRSRELSRLDTFIRCAQRTDRLPALRRVAEQLRRALAERWPSEGPLPVYPAFRSQPGATR